MCFEKKHAGKLNHFVFKRLLFFVAFTTLMKEGCSLLSCHKGRQLPDSLGFRLACKIGVYVSGAYARMAHQFLDCVYRHILGQQHDAEGVSGYVEGHVFLYLGFFTPFFMTALAH